MNSIVEQCSLLLAGNPFGVVLSRQNGNVVWANSAAGEFLGVAPGALVGAPLDRFLPGRALAVGSDIFRHRVTDADGRSRWLQRSVSTVEVASGEPLRLDVLVDLGELDQRGQMRDAVVVGRQDSRLDAETGVLNRLSVLQILSSEISRARRYGNPLSMVLVRFSDCRRLASAEVTHASSRQAVAHCVNEALRWVDSVGALDRGELLVVLPETDASAADAVSRKLGDLCAELALPEPGVALRYSIAGMAWSGELNVDKTLTQLRAEPERISFPLANPPRR